ncbi:hypothetical protein [Bremerella sp. P1]|uniref:hypothetical protein n=1 Tax=Bremerella sp. P1 TaxID=3026424 RepID=UPI002367661B|nr:hypothetical protein [Bremerella sp. P1]WDI44777.1 hypothetical protein PSR63_12605 [Bremerella sp. P1]
MRQNVSPIAAQALGKTPEEFAADEKAMQAHKLVEKYATRISTPMHSQQTGLLVAVIYELLSSTPEKKPNATARPTKGTRK